MRRLILKLPLLLGFVFFTINKINAQDLPKWIQAQNKKIPCTYFTNVDYTWEGSCLNGFAHGYGKLIYLVDDVEYYSYLHIEKGKAHGYYKDFHNTGEKAQKAYKDGFYYNDKEYAESLTYWDDGNITALEIYDEKANGYGWMRGKTYDTKETFVYKGHYVNGNREGYGVYKYPESDRIYENIYKRDANGDKQKVNKNPLTWKDIKPLKTPAPAKKIFHTIIPFMQPEDYDLFEADYQAALMKDPFDDIALMGLGGIAFLNGDYEKAISYYEQAIEHSQIFGWSHYAKGWAQINLDQYEEAATSFSKCLRYHPGNIQAYYGRGLAYFFGGDKNRAYFDFNFAIGFRPKFGHAHYFFGILNQEKDEQGAANYDMVGNIMQGLGMDEGIYDQTTNTRITMSDILGGAASGQIENHYDVEYHFAMAEKYLREAGETNLLNPLIYTIAEDLFTRKKYAPALKKFNEALANDPENAEIHGYIATCHIYLGNYKEAYSYADKMFSLEVENKIEPYFLRGSAAYFLNKQKIALKDYEKAIEINKNGMLYNNLAVIKSKINPSENLCSDFEKAYRSGYYDNYFYLHENCNYREMTETCRKCDGEGELGTGAHRWTVSNDRVEIMERCNACNGHGHIRLVHKRKPLEFIFEY